MKKVILILSLFYSISLFANNKTDSLWNIWNSKTKHDSLRLNAINDIAWEVLFSAPDSSFKLAQIQIDLAKKIKMMKWESGGYNIQGVTYAVRGDYKKSMIYFKKCLELKYIEKDKRGAAATLNNIAMLYENMGNYPKAFETIFEAIKIKEELKDSLGIANAYGNLAVVYDNIKEYDKSFGYYKLAVEIHKNIGNNKGLARVYHDMGINLKERGKIDSALILFEMSKEKFKSFNEDKVEVYTNIGVIQMEKGMLNDAESNLLFGLKLAKEYEDRGNEATAYGNLGLLYCKLKQFVKAIEYGQKGYDIANEIGALKEVKDNSYFLYQTYKQTGDKEKALYYYEKHVSIKDSLINEDKSKDMARFEVKFEFEKKEAAALLEQEKKDALINAERKKQKIVLLLVSVFLVFVSILAVIIFRSLRLNQRKNKIISEQNLIVIQQKHLVEEKHKEITDSINYAERIQRSFLATTDHLNANLNEYFILFKPKDVVSGDFYWSGTLNNGLFALITADSTGHGVPGAIMSLLNISSIEKAIESFTKPADILNSTRKTIIERLKKDGSAEGGKDGMDASLCVYDFKNKKLTISAANNPVWIIRHSGTEALEVIEIKPDKMPIGKHDRDTISFTQQEMDLQTGDVIYTLTDGFPDQFGGPNGKKFMSKNLRELLAANAHLPMSKQKQMLELTFANWVGNMEQVDDVTLVGIRV